MISSSLDNDLVSYLLKDCIYIFIGVELLYTALSVSVVEQSE